MTILARADSGLLVRIMAMAACRDAGLAACVSETERSAEIQVRDTDAVAVESELVGEGSSPQWSSWDGKRPDLDAAAEAAGAGCTY